MKLVIVLCSFAMLLFSCHRHHRHHNTSVSISEDNSSLLLKATYNSNKAYQVEQYLNTKLGYRSDFIDEDDDYETALVDDDSKVYIKSTPGHVKIKFNKRQNSRAAYEKVKSVCEGIKEVIN